MRPATFVYVGVLLAAAGFCDPGRGLWTPDEPREAGISREMYEHPAVIPTLNGQPFIEKPPLYYWSTALAFAVVGGPSVAAARAVSGLAALLTLAVVFAWVSRASSFDTAAIATVILATFAEFVTSAHWVRIDALLMLFCTLALWSAWERMGRAGGPGFLVLFYLALVLALWTKGLIGPVLVGAGLATYAALSRRWSVVAPLKPFAGAVVFVAAVGSLAAAIASSGGEPALRTWFYVNHVQRFVHPVATGHERPFAYYAWTLPIALVPWLTPLLALFRWNGPLWRREHADAALLRFAAAMTVGPIAVLSLASSKREVYLLPLLPALALLMAESVRDRIEAEGRSPRPGRWARTGDWLQAAIFGLAGIAPAAVDVVVTRGVTPVSAVFFVAGTVAAAALAMAVARREIARAFWIGAASMGLALAGVMTLVIPRVDAMKNMEPFIAGVDAILLPGEPVRAIGSDETLLGIVPFVTGRRVIPIEPKDLADAPFVVVQSDVNDPEFPSLKAAYEPVVTQDFGPVRRIALWRRRASGDGHVLR